MKEKIGLVTLFGCFNYGNRLQNYAVTKLLSKYGYSVETIVCEKLSVRAVAGRLYRTVLRIINPRNGDNKRYKNFSKFNDRELIVRRFVNKKCLIPPKIKNEYAFFVVGSDQVWNPEIRQNERSNFFLQFADREQRICISPSVAVTSISEKDKRTFSIGLRGFPYLCCREADGAKIIEDIAEKKCYHLLDPTLAINQSEWRAFSKSIDMPKKYLVSFFLGNVSIDINKKIMQYAEDNGLAIIDMSKKDSKYYSISPDEFVFLIDHATMVFTDSFHAAAFSINMNTPFYVFDRVDKVKEANNMVSRIKSLVEVLGLNTRYSDVSHLSIENFCDFSEANQRLEVERRKFDDYVKKCLRQKSEKYVFLPEHKCTGCNVCVEVCPTECLEMKKDVEGFYRPYVVETDKCVSCGECTKHCPILITNFMPNRTNQAFIAWNMNNKQIEKSSSGAIFPLLCQYVIENGGVVYGARFDSKFMVVHDRAANIEDASAFYRAKYLQSNVQGIFKQVRSDLENGLLVLFSGTPCQIGGLKAFLKKEYDKLLLVDFVCHGTPSPLVWEKYLESVQKNHLHNEKITSVNFREKKPDWQYYSLKIDTYNYTFIEDRRKNKYMQAFLRNIILRPSCYECEYKGVDRISDFTLGDFWGIEQIRLNSKNDRGTSLLIIHTEKAKTILNSISEKIHLEKIDFSEFYGKCNSALIESVPKHKNRDEFMGKINVEKIDELIAKYATEAKRSMISRIVGRLRRTIR